jgi:signal transduction histidine kinase
MSFRRRLLLTALATLAIGLGSLLVAGNVLVARGVQSEASALLRARADAQLAALDISPGAVAVRNTANDEVLDRQSWVFDGGHVVESPSDAPPALDHAAFALGRAGVAAEDDGPGDVRLRARPVYASGSDTPSGAVVVALPLGPLERLQHEILLGSLILAGLVLLAGGLAIRTAVDGALQRVAHMTASADEWGAHDLDRRFGLGPPRDELTGLAATLDGLLGRIAASRRHEQRFASEVAHELRTPLAGLRGRAELALAASGPGSGAERTQALRAVVADAGRLDATIGTLLAIARQELDPAAGSVDVGALAREVEGVDVSVAPSLPKAEGEPDVVRRALAALIDNARRHARERVSLELSAGDGQVRLAVCDDGPGVDPGLGERVFEPGVRGGRDGFGGAGLGLPLSRRLARSCGGDVVLGGGAGGCFVLELPAVR